MDYFNYKNGTYVAEDVSLAELAATYGTPFYCYSAATLTRHVQILKQSLGSLKHKICYAVKANHNLDVLRIIHAAGAGADVVSEGEIRFARAAGIRAQDIVFSGVGKTRDELAYALHEGIFQFNIESEDELETLNDVAQSKQTRAAIAIRVNPDVAAKTHAKISTGHKTSKFGIPMQQARDTYKRASMLPHIQVQGVSVHIGSQLTQLEPFAEAFEKLAEFVNQLRADGHQITTVDVGGGLGIPYGNESAPPLPEAYAEIVKQHIAPLECELLLEPGRLIAGNAGILVTKVIRTKSHDGHDFVIVDAGMNDLARPAMYDAYHEILPVNLPTSASLHAYDIVGPVCETSDIFAEQRKLPATRAGDLLAIRTSGAYGSAMSSTYNIRPLIPEIIVDAGKHRLSRRRQTYEDILNQYK